MANVNYLPSVAFTAQISQVLKYLLKGGLFGYRENCGHSCLLSQRSPIRITISLPMHDPKFRQAAPEK